MKNSKQKYEFMDVMNRMLDYSKYFVSNIDDNLMSNHFSNLNILPLTNDRVGHLRIIQKNLIDEWLNNPLNGMTML